ncbi:MAG: response regulator [Candidatus Kapaibacterium sp.]
MNNSRKIERIAETQSVKILLADDHKLFLEGVRELLQHVNWIEIVGTASNGEDVLRKLQSHYVDIIILDIQMPLMNGIKVAEQIRERNHNVKIIVVSMYGERLFVEQMIRLGVDGYLLKNTTPEELVAAIVAVKEGRKYFAHDVTALILGESVEIAPADPVTALTRRELQILRLVAKGYSGPEIAREFSLSVQTVSTHRKNIMQKLNVNNTASLVRYALTNQLID